MNLSASQWAPPNWRGQPSTSGAVGLGIPPNHPGKNVPELELSRHKKLLGRLRWKSHLLAISHQRVAQITQITQQTPPVPGVAADLGAATEAETMFKLDFFEYYVLLERVILHLLGVFNITVSADVAKESVDPYSGGVLRHTTNDDVSSGGGGGDGPPIIGSSTYDKSHYYFNHRFHANVLQALDRPTNPLHPVLGTGEVRYYLGVAKESRNRWKDAEEEDGQVQAVVPGSGALKHQRMLKNVDLEVMLACILDALDKAQVLAEEYVRVSEHHVNGVTGSTQEGLTMEYDMEDIPMEAMPDAMEWEEF